MKHVLSSLALVAALASPAGAAPPREIHSRPEEKLDRIDVALINTAARSVNLASYALTEKAVIDALKGISTRGSTDPRPVWPQKSEDWQAIAALAATASLHHWAIQSDEVVSNLTEGTRT